MNYGVRIFQPTSQGSGDFSGQAAGKGYQTIAVLGQQRFIHSGTEIETLHGSVGDEFHQVIVTCLVMGQ
jgi:hypothetical protein